MHRTYEDKRTLVRKKGAGAKIRGWLFRALPWGIVVYLATGFYVVQPNERAVVRRFGRAIPGVVGPGLHWGLPVPLDRVDRLRVFEHKRVPIGGLLMERSLGRRIQPQELECLTGDYNLILLSGIAQYRIRDCHAYLFACVDVPQTVAMVTTSVFCELMSRSGVDSVLTVDRLTLQSSAQRTVQEILDQYGLGVEIMSISLEGLSPPAEVANAFREVTAAREDAQRLVNEAQSYANSLLPKARGEADRLLQEAESHGNEILARAQGNRDRFLQMVGELGTNRAANLRRLYWESLERILPRLRKIVLDRETSEQAGLSLIEIE